MYALCCLLLVVCCCLPSAAVLLVLGPTQVPIKDHVVAMETVMDFLRRHVSDGILKEVVAVGHRCVSRGGRCGCV
jgi:hypothetical protein